MNHNSPALLIWVAPLISVVGVVATAIVLRTRWRVRASLYESLREERQSKIAMARVRISSPALRAVAVAPAQSLAIDSSAAREPAGEEPSESRLHAAFGYVSLSAALLTILLGVLLLVGQARL